MQHLLSSLQTEQGFLLMSILVETLFLIEQYKGIQLLMSLINTWGNDKVF
jgi:hypothetical protein